MDQTTEHQEDGHPAQTSQSLSSLFNLTSLGGEARSQLSKSRDPNHSMSLTSTTSTSSVSLTTEDSASNTTVVQLANKSKKRPLSSPDASSSKQAKTYPAVELPPDEMTLYKYTGYRYTTKLRGHCTTRNLVYLITCTKCAKQYVGETKREFRFRMAEHVRDTRVKRETPVSIHFNEPDHSFENMVFQIIHILPTDPEDDGSTIRRRQCEKYWIYQLHSLRPLGINVFG